MSKRLKILGVIILIGFIALGAYLMTGGKAPGRNSASKYMIEYKSFDRLQASTQFEINIPRYLLEQSDVEYIAYPDGLIQIRNERFSYKQGKYIADNIDIAGISGEKQFDVQYKYIHNGNEYLIKYQIAGTDTALSWYGCDQMCGLLMHNYDGFNGMEALMKSIGIQPEKLQVIEDEQSTNSIRYITYKLEQNQISFEFPITEDNINIINEASDNNEYERVIILLVGKVVSIIERTDVGNTDITNELFDCYEKDGYKIAVLKENPFESEGSGFNSFELIKCNIEHIINTFTNFKTD